MKLFPKDFTWGVASAAYQVEGAFDKDGRGPSIWDTFSKTPGKVLHAHNGDIACDHYHRYPQDMELMRKMGSNSYRFSISWPRIVPEGSGKINQKGIDFYKKMLATMHEKGLSPLATLYHWDLPQPLQDKGGWANRDTAFRFNEYAQIVYKELGDLIPNYITLNEPWCISILSHLMGAHAPGIKDHQIAMDVAHHVNLAHGLCVKSLRDSGRKSRIGPTLNPFILKPATNLPEDLLAADIATDQARLFMNPIFGKPYPQRYLDNYGLTMPIQNGDYEIMNQPVDFVGLNYYWETTAESDLTSVDKFKKARTWQDETDIKWPITPRGLYRLLDWMMKEYPDAIKELIITENGAAFDDVPDHGYNRVQDPKRIAYLESHLTECLDAIEAGIPLTGYYIWTFMDNFEWALGYTERFGIVYIDYGTQQRIPKDSYYFMREVIAGQHRFS